MKEEKLNPRADFGGRRMTMTERIIGHDNTGEIWVFTIDNITDRDGCLFVIEPGKATNAVEVFSNRMMASEEVVWGDGWLLTMPSIGSLAREITCIHKAVGDEPFTYDSGVGVWIAGKNGLVVRNVTSPPFSLDMEEVIKFGDPRIVSEFWDLLKNPRKVVPSY